MPKSVPPRKNESVNHSSREPSGSEEIKQQEPVDGFVAKSVETRKELPEDALKERDKSRGNYWDQIDALFYGTLKHAETAFRINVALNIIVAAVGLALLTYAIGYSWVHGLDLYSTAFGSLGVASFVAIFYFTPQRKIQRTTGDLAQLQMLYRSYCMQAEEVNDLCYRHNPKTIEELEKIDNHLTKLTTDICDKIELLVGEKDTSKGQ